MRGISDRGVVKTGRSKLGRWVALGVAAVIAMVAGAYVYEGRSDMQNFQRSALEGAVTVYAYNFTPYDIAYSTTPGRRWFSDANDASGKNAYGFGYKPTSPEAPLDVSWRYNSGPQATEDGNYPFHATFLQPKRPAGEVVLELRFYPDGKVAARYATTPLGLASGNVDPELPGNDWVSNR